MVVRDFFLLTHKYITMTQTTTTTLKNEYHTQADKFLSDTETKYACFYYDNDFFFPDDKETRDIYTIRLRNKNHSYTFRFGQSVANKGIAPHAYDILSCITKHDPGTFQNFCDDFGYDTNSKRAEKTYKTVVKEYRNVSKLFTNDQLELLSEIF